MIDLEKLERLHAEATPGPWVIRHGDGWYNKHSYEIEASDESHVAETLYAYNGEADAAYITAACNALPALIAENRALREKVAEYSSELAVLLGVKHDFEKRVRELERQRGFFLNALKENYLCPYSCCKCDVGSDVEEWDCTAADNRGCWIEAAEEAAKEAGE